MVRGQLLATAFRFFGPSAVRSLERRPELQTQLLQARIALSPEAYLSLVYLLTAAVGSVGFFVAFILCAALGFPLGPALTVLLLLVATAGPALLVYLYSVFYPENRLRSRAKNLEARLPFAVSYLAALAAAGAVPHNAFRSLARQKVYGEVAAEAAWIYRDVTVMGMDIVSALREAANRSPSRSFAEFCNGITFTITTGGDLTLYLNSKAAQIEAAAERRQRDFLHNMDLLSESYITVAAAAPLFLVVTLSVLSLVSGRVDNSILFLNIVVFGMLPVLHGVFAVLMKGMKPEE